MNIDRHDVKLMIDLAILEERERQQAVTNNLHDAIVNIEKELGIQPSASHPTVADRLANIEDHLPQ